MTTLKHPPTLRTMTPKKKGPRYRGASLEDSLLLEPHNYTQCEQAVWRAVIVQAVTDALSRSKKREMIRHKREALAWLTGFSRDFRTVCEHAGFDPTYIREKVRDLFLEHTRQSEHFHASQPDTPRSFSLRLPPMQTRLDRRISLSNTKEESE